MGLGNPFIKECNLNVIFNLVVTKETTSFILILCYNGFVYQKALIRTFQTSLFTTQ